MKTIKINVEANIGTGKSTLIRRLGEIQGNETVEEPVKSWTNLEGKNMLEAMYYGEQVARCLVHLHVLL